MRSEWILVVEDDAQIRNFITYTLKQEGFPCLTAGNAQGHCPSWCPTRLT